MLLPQLRVERLEVPDELLACAPAPAVPDPESLTRGAAAGWLLAALAARDDCASKLDAVRGLVRP